MTLPAGSNFVWRVAHCYIIHKYLWAPLYESICMQELINTDFSTTRLEAVFHRRSSSTDPGGGFRRNKQQKSEWHLPRGNSKRGHWSADSQEFPSLEVQRTAGNTKGSTGPSTTEVDRRPTGHQTPVLRNLDRGMRPAKDIQPVPRGNRNARPRGVQKTIVIPLSAVAEKFTPRKISGQGNNRPRMCPRTMNSTGPLPRPVRLK